jgi:hypothetical protein
MKTLKAAILASAVALITISCKEGNKKESEMPENNGMHQEDMNDQDITMKDDQDKKTKEIVDQYLSLKDALVEDNSEKAAMAGRKLATAFENFDALGYSDSEQDELKDVIENAKEQAKLISDNPIGRQREYFKTLSKDVTSIITIAGTDKKLYEQFCPMYDKGTAWLSASNEIRNPFYGSEMLTCGKVQREIN